MAFSKDFGQGTRAVFLTGAAVFNVTKDAKRPFLVHANELVTKVLGTKFVVSAFEKDKNITVTVQSGQVSVYRLEKNGQDQSKKGVLLLPNQQVVFERSSEHFKKTLVELPQPTEGPAEAAVSFELEEVPVAEVFGRIKKAYGIEVIFDADNLKNCQITASLGSEPLFEKLNIIARVVGGSFETVDGQVVFSAKGCK